MRAEDAFRKSPIQRRMWRGRRCAPRKTARSSHRHVSHIFTEAIKAPWAAGETSRERSSDVLHCGAAVYLSECGRRMKSVCPLLHFTVACPSSSSVRPGYDPGAEDQASSVLGGPGGMWDLERGLLPGRSLVRLVDGTRDRVGGRLASGLWVGLPVYLIRPWCIHGSLGLLEHNVLKYVWLKYSKAFTDNI